ncbi:sensor histidine kinase [Porticoccus sp.]
MEALVAFFSGEGFMPHGHCYFWTPGLLWLNVTSDGLTAIAYTTIPFTLAYLVRKRQDIPFNWMFVAFGIFILACGATHMMDILTTWYPAYWLSGYIRGITALASIVTAYLLIRLIPTALALPSQKQLVEANAALARTNAELQEANRRLEEAQQELLQREKMAALGGLVAGVAHEINTPIGIIVTSSSMLTQQTHQLRAHYQQGDLSEEEFEDYMETAELSAQLIESNATRAADLIHSFKQVAVDQSSQEQREINVGEYIRETLASLTPALKKSSVSVEVTGPTDLNISTYPGALAQVLTNLVLNSLNHGFDQDFTEEAGRIHIHFEKVGDQILLRYTDNGRGIPKELRIKVFEPFFTTKRHAGGSGLGLHILHNLVTATLNGKVQIDEPRDGRGVQFVMEFPYNGAQTA